MASFQALGLRDHGDAVGVFDPHRHHALAKGEHGTEKVAEPAVVTQRLQVRRLVGAHLLEGLMHQQIAE